MAILQPARETALKRIDHGAHALERVDPWKMDSSALQDALCGEQSSLEVLRLSYEAMRQAKDYDAKAAISSNKWVPSASCTHLAQFEAI